MLVWEPRVRGPRRQGSTDEGHPRVVVNLLEVCALPQLVIPYCADVVAKWGRAAVLVEVCGGKCVLAYRMLLDTTEEDFGWHVGGV